MARSIETFGFNVPILVDGDSCVVAGHARLGAARQLGLAEVPTICLAHLSKPQLQAFMIADNHLSELSTRDDTLGKTLRDLSTLNLDFSLEVTGFDMGEIDLRIEGLETIGNADRPDPADMQPELHPGSPVSERGDLWCAGRHRLLCGNALEASSYEVLMQGKQAAMVFTDPPYNVRIQGHVSGLGKTHHREFEMASGEMTTAEFVTFLQNVMTLHAANSRDGSLHMVCMDWRHIKNLLGSLYRSQHEMVAVYKHGTGKHTNNVELGRHGRNRTNVWSYPGVKSFGRKSDEGNLLAMHPTVKPVKLVTDAILDCTARGEGVLDAFLGSGTTLIAAERVGRCCYGLELDSLYVDTALRRWQALTGDTARHATTGETFDEVAAGRRSGKETTDVG